MNIIGYHIINGLAVNSDGESAITNPLDFILQDEPGTIRVFYHLDHAVACLCKWINLDKKDLRSLTNGDLYAAPYKFNYRSKKYFNLQHGSGRGAPFANFSDMYQFHRNSDMTEKEPYEYAQLAQQIGQQVYDTLCKLDLNPTALTSPVRCWEKEVLSTLDLPAMKDLPEEAARMTYKCCDGGWVESFQKGHWNKTWDYDMRSAYGSFTRNLLDTRAGKWIQASFYDPAAYYGYALCDIEITANFSPISFNGNKNEITPVGKWQRYLTKHHIDFITKYNLGTVDIIDGWWWFPDKLVTPLESMIDYLYKAKETTNISIEKDVIKRILAGIWGKFLQINTNPKKDEDPFGDLFNPVWAAEVETQTRLNTAKFVLDNQLEKNVLHVAVDGVLSSREVTINDTGKAGEWKLSNTGAAFILSSGICAVQGKDSVISEANSPKEGSDFILRYDWLSQQIKANPYASEYQMVKLSPVSVPKAVTQDKMHILGQHEEIVKTVEIAFETKREYDKLPFTGSDLLHHRYISKPKDLRATYKKIEEA